MPHDNRFIKRNLAYGIGQPQIDLAPKPIVAQRGPTATDRGEIGQPWIDQPNDDVHFLTSVAAGVSTWINAGGGSGTFNSLVVTTTADIGTDLTVGGTTTLSALGLGTVQSDATGVLSSANGTDGQLLIGGTGVQSVWGSITSATLVITPGAGTLNIEESGGTANSFLTDVAGPVAPLLGVTGMLGGTNMFTDGSLASTIVFDLNNSITLVGGVTAGVDLTMSTGTCTINADDDVTGAIYLETNGGTNETIEIISQQGTANDSINIQSVSGGINMNAAEAAADAIYIAASDVAGGVTVESGTGGYTLNSTGAIDIGVDANQKIITAGNVTGTTSFVVDCGTGGASFGASATVHTTTVGSTTGASATVIQSGTGDLALTSTDDMLLDCAGSMELNSSAGNIEIGADNDDFDINIGTLGERIVTVGNITGITAVGLSSGTGGIDLLSAALGDITLDSGGDVLIDSDGVLNLNSTAGIIGIGDDADAFAINIGTGAAQRDITLGNATGTTSIAIDAGSGGIDITAADSQIALISGIGAINIGTDVAQKTITMGNGTGATAVAVYSGTGDLDLGTNAVAHAVNIGNITGISSVVVDCGTGGISLGASATAHTTTVGSTNTTSDTTIQAGSGGISLEAAGIVDVPAATDAQAGAGVTINANVGVGTFTGLTTAAAASQVLTVTNSVCTVNSAILCTIANKGANDAQCTVTRVVPAAGSFTVTYQNLGAAALNGDIILTFWILVA